MAFSYTILPTVSARSFACVVTATADGDTGGVITLPWQPVLNPGGRVAVRGYIGPVSAFYYLSQWAVSLAPGPTVFDFVLTKTAAVGSGSPLPQAAVLVELLDSLSV